MIDHGHLQITEMDDEIKKLMGLANLRNLSIKWNHTAMQLPRARPRPARAYPAPVWTGVCYPNPDL